MPYFFLYSSLDARHPLATIPWPAAPPNLSPIFSFSRVFIWRDIFNGTTHYKGYFLCSTRWYVQTWKFNISFTGHHHQFIILIQLWSTKCSILNLFQVYIHPCIFQICLTKNWWWRPTNETSYFKFENVF